MIKFNALLTFTVINNPVKARLGISQTGFPVTMVPIGSAARPYPTIGYWIKGSGDVATTAPKSALAGSIAIASDFQSMLFMDMFDASVFIVVKLG